MSGCDNPLCNIIICQKEPFEDWNELKKFYREIFERNKINDNYSNKFKNWDKNKSVFECKGQWIFRAQPGSSKLETTLERAINRIDKCLLQKAHKFEDLCLKEFKRQLHNYVSNVPKDDDILDWLAVLRHYEGPSRLLDFTYSFYVAAHFAFESHAKKVAIWAIDSKWCTNKGAKILGLKEKDHQLGKNPKLFNKYFWPKEPSERKELIYPVTPNRLNPRLAVQQGAFLCPGDVCSPFQKNITSMFENEDAIPIVKLLIHNSHGSKIRNKGLKDLYRMNITYASLYPGLVGFSKLMETKLVFPELLENNN